MTITPIKSLLKNPTQIPMLKVFVADPHYATNSVPSYVCAIDVEGVVDLSDISDTGFIYRMKLAFARALDNCLDCLIHADTRTEIIEDNFFNVGTNINPTQNARLLKAINSIARAIEAKANLYCNKLSFDVMQDGWLDASPFDLEFRVEWVDVA